MKTKACVCFHRVGLLLAILGLQAAHGMHLSRVETSDRIAEMTDHLADDGPSSSLIKADHTSHQSPEPLQPPEIYELEGSRDEIHTQLTQPQKNLKKIRNNLPAKISLREIEIHNTVVSFLHTYTRRLSEFHQEIRALHDPVYDLTDEEKAEMANKLARQLSDLADFAEVLNRGTNTYFKAEFAQFQELILQVVQSMKDSGKFTDEQLERFRNVGLVESESEAAHSSSSRDAFPGRVSPP